jgi:hypothetical protein
MFGSVRINKLVLHKFRLLITKDRSLWRAWFGRDYGPEWMNEWKKERKNERMEFQKNLDGYGHKLTSKYYCCWRRYVYNGRHNNTGCATLNYDRNPQWLIFTLVVTFSLYSCCTVQRKITETDEMQITIT